ncbi:MAG TPA: aminotransferase class V-fold PLP-dependent enzyme [Dermatophilaceae bacterium]
MARSGMLILMDPTWDLEGIRAQYPALRDGTVFLDGAGGTQVPECVIEAISDAHRSGLSNVHGPFAASRRSDRLIEGAREAVADLTGGSAGGVVAIAHAAGALIYVDAVAAAPHFRLDLSLLGADFLAVSSYKWCGPQAGAVVAPVDLLETLHPDKLEPSSERVSERFEIGTAGLANMAGITAAVARRTRT